MSLLLGAIDMNQPGRYFHWSVFTFSEANFVLVVVMVVIFGAALLLPFPHGRGLTGRGGAPATSDEGDGTGIDAAPPNDGAEGPSAAAEVSFRPEEGATARGRSGAERSGDDPEMWTARIRRRLVGALPPERLIPDKQPAYVASWVYVFGVATLAALGVVIVSGFAIAIGGVDWWHTNPVGHFFNSLHLWSVELFMAFMVIHLWGKFWMAAWRGRRGRTWVTGMAAFMASIAEAFTGYLSQQNFDSQWISTSGKDAFNAVGVGAFFNVMNFGQMLLWHVVLLPLLLVVLVGAHVLLVRVRGVVHPIGTDRESATTRRQRLRAEAAEWRGPTRRYDIAKEATIATGVVLVLTFLLAGFLSSPDMPSLTIRSWARVAPADFLGTAASELAGTSKTAQYGPPYNDANGSVQKIVVPLQTAAGVRQRLDPVQAFVLGPLAKEDPGNAALAAYRAASPAQQQAWANAYLKAVDKVTFHGGEPSVPRANDGPVPALLARELFFARSGALDADLVAQRSFYGTNFTAPLLFLEDGSYFASQAQAQHLTGEQWGVMNETGSYPGQPWLWLYQLWYQLPGFRDSPNVDVIAVYLTGVATILLLLVPFIPGLREIPRWVPVHRLVWKSWYRRSSAGT